MHNTGAKELYGEQYEPDEVDIGQIDIGSNQQLARTTPSVRIYVVMAAKRKAELKMCKVKGQTDRYCKQSGGEIGVARLLACKT